ncbi:A24 family peptidase [Ramlibacter sp. AN1015]|uniref:A24 family peptidase n=1 Tax=Ramlibacter sp. AN1015 TaxID=3133428 RepID=UPI0030BFDB39
MNPSWSLASLPWNPGIGALIALLLLAAWIDWRTMRIPNWLTVGGMCLGMLWNVASGADPIDGLLTALGGLGLGLALFLPLWLLRAMGAGDVKLIAMTGAFLGAAAAFKAILLTGIVGGVFALYFALAHRATGQMARNLRDLAYSAVLRGVPLWRPNPAAPAVGKLPYGVSICAGTLAYLALRQLGYA